MSVNINPTQMVNLNLIPESAPFSEDQRAWLSGFLAAVITAPPTATPAPPAMPAPTSVNVASNDDAPWHDPSLAIAARMDMAKDRPLAPRLMAAMAQQDCGQCGYTCAAYANVLADGSEERLNLCAPGGKDTARMLKALAAEIGSAPAGTKVDATDVHVSETPLALGYSREAPATARFLSRRRLNGIESAKDTWHIELDLTDTGIDYTVGDSLGVFVHNEPGLVDQIIAMLGASHITQVRGKTLRAVLQQDVSLNPAPDALFELLSYLCGGAMREKARALARGEDPDGDAAHLDVLAVLQKFANVRPHPEAFVEALEPLQPRLYSISSSPKPNPNRISLSVDAVRYVIGKRKRLGVASTCLADRLEAGAPLKVYLQKAHNFALPSNPSVPVIMVGPGTGIAPFRAFLQEREATHAPGKNWLFFGHQHMKTDFFYRDELEAMQKSGRLTRLSLAWSRDGDQKFYVQDRMREVGASLWQWLEEGAHVYICGDAKRMAKDVEAALVDIVAIHGKCSADEAVRFVQGLKKDARYQADVY